MQAIVVDSNVHGRLTRQEVFAPVPGPSEALVSVRAFSLNRGETKRALTTAPAGSRPGWDLAGVVQKAAANGSGPKVGARVVGLVPSGAWAEQVAVSTEALAELPDGVSFAQAATLPVAGLTALHALYKGGLLLGKRVLITGATGGVGDYAIQLARLGGATITAHIRRDDQIDFVHTSGAHNVAIGDEWVQSAKEMGPFDLIVESVGGDVLGAALPMLAERGVCVLFGTAGEAPMSFNAQAFYAIGGASLYGMLLNDELRWYEPAKEGLAKLSALIVEGKLTPHITVQEPWDKTAEVAQGLLERRYPGKAVLTVGAQEND
jgi:NADPH2:quinone reductase